MKIILYPAAIVIVLCISKTLFAQVAVNTDGSAADASAMLDVKSNSKGLLAPRMTTVQRQAIVNPAFGLIVFDSDKGALMFYDGANWQALSFTNANYIPLQNRTFNDVSQAGGVPAFGQSVAISGNYAIVGNGYFSPAAPGYANMGAAYIFAKTAAGWQQQARLTASDSSSSDLFGSTVAISGDYAVVGVPGKTIGSKQYQGKVYIFKRNGNAWLQDTALTNSSGNANDYFGWSVAISANGSTEPRVVVGATGVNGTKGGISVYARNGSGTWALIQQISPSDLSGNDQYGAAVSIDGDYLAVGTPNQTFTINSTIYRGAGALYIYVYGGGVWTLQQKIQGSAEYAALGYSLSISGNNIAVGAPFFNNSIGSSPVYMYTRTGATWNTNASSLIYLNSADGGNSSLLFGICLSLSGTDLLIGSGYKFFPTGGTSSSGIQGAVYLYKNYSGNVFSRVRVLKAQNPYGGDSYGAAVGISNGNYIIGIPNATVNGAPQGSVDFGVTSN